MSTETYPKGQHPHWCLLGEECNGADPTHVGRGSQIFVQDGEGRLTIMLSRRDEDVVDAGTTPGAVKVRVTLWDPYSAGSISVELKAEESRAAAFLFAQSADFAERESQHPLHYSAEVIRAEGSM